VKTSSAFLALSASAAALVTGCGGGGQAGVRIYDPSGRVKAVVSGGDFVRSSARALKVGGSWSVNVSLTTKGRGHLLALTSALARRGRRLRHPQHMAIAVNGHVEETPYVDYRNMPRGFDGRGGVELAVLSQADAKRFAKALRSQ